MQPQRKKQLLKFFIFLTLLSIAFLEKGLAKSRNKHWHTQPPPLIQLNQTIRLSQKTHRTRLVFTFSGPFQFHGTTRSHPQRLLITIDHATKKGVLFIPSLVRTPVHSIRITTNGHQYLKRKKGKQQIKIRLDLKKPVKAKLFRLPPMKNYGHRLVIDLYTPAPLPPPTHSKPITPVITIDEHKQHEVITVTIDPGHGGKDPGAIGVQGIQEKDIVLAVAKRLQHLINQQPGFRAILTRNGDYFLALRKRLLIARHYQSDLFIAIHADAYFHQRAQGASVYALSRRGATSEAARWLAQKENHSELMGGANLSNTSDMLRSVLISLQETATIRSSLQMGQSILNALGKHTVLHHNKVEQAAFVVLKSLDIPSLLIELGFLSNPHEEIKLRSKHYQETLARAIMRGIKAYLMAFNVNYNHNTSNNKEMNHYSPSHASSTHSNTH